MKHPFITVIGNVGAGKSTLARFLAQKLPAHLVAADELYKTNPFFQDAVVDRARWSLASDIWFLTRRVEMAQELEKILTKQAVVQDSGLLMSWVYANSRLAAKHMNEQEMELYNELFEKCTKTTVRENLVINLKLPVPLLLERINDRGREFEMKYFTPQYLEGIQRSLDTLIVRLKSQGQKVLEYTHVNGHDVINSSKNQKDVVQKVRRLVT
ncbi:deoxynucleoside kinase [Candidatus Gottesmanbacteria bacterium]|nr:deoxynucleoside kinase [Candidatus Gottesmanbacteria bacterium]